jgi:hypothetical protein
MLKGIGKVSGLGKTARRFDSVLTFNIEEESSHYSEKNLLINSSTDFSKYLSKNIKRDMQGKRLG